MSAEGKVADRWVRQVLAASKVLYTGVFLTPASQRRLLQEVGQAHSQLFAHHMTIWVKNDGGSPQLEDLPLGQKVSLRVVDYVADDEAQAVVVEPPSIARPRNGRIPHITISTIAGTPPSYSNRLIADRDRGTPRPDVSEIEGLVGWWDGKQARYDFPEGGVK